MHRATSKSERHLGLLPAYGGRSKAAVCSHPHLRAEPARGRVPCRGLVSTTCLDEEEGKCAVYILRNADTIAPMSMTPGTAQVREGQGALNV